MSQACTSKGIDSIMSKYRSVAPSPTSGGNNNALCTTEGIQSTSKPYDVNKLVKPKGDSGCLIKNHRPFLLMRTHFEISKESFAPLSIVDHIESNILPKFDSIDFSADLYFTSDGLGANVWHGKYIYGAICSSFDLFVYEERNSYIIEVNKTRGDSKPFAQFFYQLKALFIPVKKEVTSQPTLYNFGSLTCRPISDEDFLKGLQPVFRMAKATNYEARLESAKMLCDLFQHKQSQLQNMDVRKACIESVELLIHDIFPDVQEFAVMAMSLMAEVDHSYKMELMRSSALLVIVKMVVDNPKSPSLNYETIQTRRECAKILVTLAAESNYHLLKESIIEQAGMDEKFLQNWLNQVHTIEDYRLRHQTEKAFPDDMMVIMPKA
eukprot:gene33254-42998_t